MPESERMVVGHANAAGGDLAVAYDNYRAACTALRARHLISDSAAEHVVRTRLQLCRALIADGWVPPAAVQVVMARDEALLAVPTPVGLPSRCA